MPATTSADPSALDRQYRRAREDAAFFDLGSRALLVTTGPLRQKFLHGMLSNDLQSRQAGQGCRASLMDAKGHLLVFLRALVTESEIVLELPADRRDEIARLLEHYRVAAPVRFAPSTDAVIGLVGPAALDHLRGLGGLLAASAPESHVQAEIAGARVRVVRAGDLPGDGYVLHVGQDSAPAVRGALAEAGVAALSMKVLDALRIEDGRPWFGPDVSPKNLLHETGLVSEYHSAAKGCYVGQEVIARLEARGGNVNQRLRGLRLSEPRPAGTVLRAEGREAGTLTTSAVSPRLGPIAMGYVHRSHFEPGTVLEADGARAEVALLPLAAPAPR